MKHKDEILVCPVCKKSAFETELTTLPQEHGTLVNEESRTILACAGKFSIPYLPSSSVKDLVEAAKDVVNENKTKYPILGKGVISIDTLKKLEAALGERKD